MSQLVVPTSQLLPIVLDALAALAAICAIGCFGAIIGLAAVMVASVGGRRRIPG